jgi:hypothetical protein
MRTHTALAALLFAVASVLQVPAFAHPDASSQLQLRVVDRANLPLSSATVTVYTLDGNPGVTAKTDAEGKVVFTKLGSGMAQVVARANGYSVYIEKTTLQAGENMQTVKLDTENGSVTTAVAPGQPRS